MYIYVCMCMYVRMYVLINTGTSPLLDTYVRTMPKGAQCLRATADISGNARVPMLQLIKLHFQHSKNLPEFIANRSAYLYSKG